MMFSSTVLAVDRRMFWKVRETPACAIVAGSAVADGCHQPGGAGDGRAVDRDDRVAHVDTGGGGRRARLDLRDQRAAAAVEPVGEADAQVAGRRRAPVGRVAQAVDRGQQLLVGDRKADAVGR